MLKMRNVRKTSDDYSAAVMADYHRRKTDLHEGLLIAPSPAGLRDLCLKMAVNGITVADENVFRTFFRLNSSEDLLRGIKKFDLEKFRPVINFMGGKSRATDARNLNFIAVLIDFELRPLNRFICSDAVIEPSASGTEVKKVDFSAELHSGKRNRSYVASGIVSAVLVCVVIYLSIFSQSDEKQCMGWDGHAYEKLDCRTSKGVSVRAYEAQQFAVSEINANPKTRFFKNGRPIVWYLRHDGKYEFFDHPGHHPVKISQALLPVSRHIAMQVVSGAIKADY